MHYKSRLLLLLGEFSKKNSCVTICSILAWGRNFENSNSSIFDEIITFSLFAKQRHSRTSTGLCQAVSKVMSKYSSLPWYTVHTALKVRFLSQKFNFLTNYPNSNFLANATFATFYQINNFSDFFIDLGFWTKINILTLCVEQESNKEK